MFLVISLYYLHPPEAFRGFFGLPFIILAVTLPLLQCVERFHFYCSFSGRFMHKECFWPHFEKQDGHHGRFFDDHEAF